jgi:hypothetical protein
VTGRPRRRDVSFLQMAAVAGIGGILAITLAIGIPIWAWHQGRPYTPAFSLFAAWGIAALGGAYACWRTYMLSDIPEPPPRGGVRLRIVAMTDARPAPAVDDVERRAA